MSKNRKKTKIIAEIGQAHEGSLGILHSYIDSVAMYGVDVIKFQMHIAEAESSKFEPFRVNFSYEDKTRFDYWKRMEFSFEQWVGIKKHCDDLGLEFLVTPFSIKAIDQLEKMGVSAYKVGSADTSNSLLIKKLSLTEKDLIVSTGMSNYNEISTCLGFFKNPKQNISIMQCTTKYPTQASEIGLNNIRIMKEKYKIPVGLSDHSGSIYPSLAATALGADLIEVHVVFDKQSFGPDSSSSLNFKELQMLTEGVNYINEINLNPIAKDQMDHHKLKSVFGRSLAVNKNLKAGHKIEFKDLECKKPPGLGIDVNDFQSILGKPLAKNLSKWDFLNLEDFE